MKSRVDRFVLTVFHYPNSVMCLATLNVDNGDVLFWRAHQSKLVDILSVADLIRLSNIHTSAVDLYLEGSEMHNIALVNTFLSSKFPFNNANIRVFARSFDFIMSLPFSRLLSTNSNWTFWLIVSFKKVPIRLIFFFRSFKRQIMQRPKQYIHLSLKTQLFWSTSMV